MSLSRWSVAALAIALVCPFPAMAADAGALDSLVAAERAFARASIEKGVRDAFLEFLAEDGRRVRRFEYRRSGVGPPPHLTGWACLTAV